MDDLKYWENSTISGLNGFRPSNKVNTPVYSFGDIQHIPLFNPLT